MPARPAIGFTLRELKGMFFTSPEVIRAMDDATYRALLRFGQYVRKTARHSIKSGEGPSAPGTPPHSQTGLLKGHIYYGFDPAQRSVVIGPALLRGAHGYREATVPEVLEYGGAVRGRDRKRRGYPDRPYMGPAFEAGQEKLDEFWRDSVK
jgi:hypothetical protein